MEEARKHAVFNSVKAEAFAGEFLSALNHGALCLMTSIGHRTGLFDTMSALPPSTADAIAKRAGLNERYVCEGLSAMWGEEKRREHLHEAGFRHVRTTRPAHDVQYNW